VGESPDDLDQHRQGEQTGAGSRDVASELIYLTKALKARP